MKFWTIADMHLGHTPKMIECGRPEGFESIILNALMECCTEGDVLINLGDICIGADLGWHNELRHIPCKKWLAKGNHDGKSASWYIDHGWDFVGKTFTLNMFGHKILFSHKPQPDGDYTLNIHGHLHGSDHRKDEPEMVAVRNDKQVLFALELTGYRPMPLKTIIERRGLQQ